MYESIFDLKTEQHVNLIFVEKAEAGTLKVSKHASYAEIDEQLQNLVSSFAYISSKRIFQKNPELYLIFRLFNISVVAKM